MKEVINISHNERDPRRNASHYMDLTAYEAIEKVDREADAERRYKKLLSTIFYICDLAGFHIENRLEIRDKKTGKVWR